MGMSKSKGNMYDWVTHMHTHLGGECGHECTYCYVNSFDGGSKPEKFCGEIRLLENEFDVNYGEGKTIFIEHCNDLFAENVPDEFIERILEHCCKFPNNTYVFQTKDPWRMYRFRKKLPKNSICGTTIETNRDMSNISKAPEAYVRASGIEALSLAVSQTFITVEPILKFDEYAFLHLLIDSDVCFINIGADSKDNGLEEPTYDEVMTLYERLDDAGCTIRKKVNLERLRDA